MSNMPQTISIIVALKGQDEENNGAIMKFGEGASLDTLRQLAAEKLGMALPISEIVFEDANGNILSGVDAVRNQQVAYVSAAHKIKTIIPGPVPLPFVGNLFELLPDVLANWRRLFTEYGPVVKINIMGHEDIHTNDPAVAQIVVKESEYFTKIFASHLVEVKPIGGNGLFTSDTDTMDWKLAHKLLMPAFSPRATKVYQREMGEIVMKTITVFEQFAENEPVSIVDWTTNLTFETIGRIGFGFDFHLLDSRDAPQHPFIQAMSFCLGQSAQRKSQAQFIKHLPIEVNRRFDRELKLMQEIVEEVVRARKLSPDAKNSEKDLLGYMLNAVSEEGLGLSDELIRDEVLTFLIAGHETTSTTLAWTLYELDRNPEVQKKVLQEIVDVGITHNVLPTPEQISKLKYIHQVLKETLRMYPPIRHLGKYCKKDCVIPGGFVIKAGSSVVINLGAMHYNPAVYPDPNAYKPERFTPEEEQNRSRFAWLPFSTGPRGCIGMSFALQEAKTVLAMLLHRFEFKYIGNAPGKYDPKSATIRPLNLKMTIHPRTNLPKPSEDTHVTPPTSPIVTATTTATTITATANPPRPISVANIPLPRATFLFGTQTGSSQDYASQLAGRAKAFGFKDVKLADLDKWTVLQDGKYQSTTAEEELVVICTSTYNGQPPDNAEKFDRFINDSSKDASLPLKGLSYTVLGLGNCNWRTYQYFPIKIDSRLEELGATRFFPKGDCDADKDMDASFADWSTRFWSHTLQMYGVQTSVETGVKISSAALNNPTEDVVVEYITLSHTEDWGSAQVNRNGDARVTLKVGRELQNVELSGRSTRHLEIDIEQLRANGDELLYKAGDHLEVMPQNDECVVEAVALGFGLILDAVFEVKEVSLSLSSRSLASVIKGPCSIRNALTFYADLLSPPSRYVLNSFASRLEKGHKDIAAHFLSLVQPGEEGQAKYDEFIAKHRTLLDLQHAYPMVNELSLKEFLCAVMVMQPRRYSIASSHLKHPNTAHLTVGIIKDIVNGKPYPGLASGFLGSAQPGTTFRASVKRPKTTFALPSDSTTPIIMIAAGTGLSPFRGFLQERQALGLKSTAKGGASDAYLFFGCRHIDQDFIYRDELEAFVEDGTLTALHTAFSRNSDKPKRYTQHHIMANAVHVWKLITEHKAVVYICGSGYMSKDVHRTFELMAQSLGGCADDEQAKAYMNKLTEEGQYNEDVWG
ncbi:cytochrome P450 [Jimgerdemannia flammicorona]|uniref:NADPH--hemoprotein reductase n=1 Tax=Jimgerdemannia flammicorona TaxID=994334 RepID=A0A433AZY5_9FUNG|nr:cytochrome P450 [Jimgerdemannia flammicorona]